MLASPCPNGKQYKWFSLHPATTKWVHFDSNRLTELLRNTFAVSKNEELSIPEQLSISYSKYICNHTFNGVSEVYSTAPLYAKPRGKYSLKECEIYLILKKLLSFGFRMLFALTGIGLLAQLFKICNICDK